MPVSSSSSIWIVVGALVWVLTANLFITNYFNDNNIRTTKEVLTDITQDNFQSNLDENLTISTNIISTTINVGLTPFQVFWKAVFFQVTGLPVTVLFFAIHLPILIMITGIISLLRFG